jgi:hypothetical protein
VISAPFPEWLSWIQRCYWVNIGSFLAIVYLYFIIPVSKKRKKILPWICSADDELDDEDEWKEPEDD